jgi:outer membrane protein assembly factor BamB
VLAAIEAANGALLWKAERAGSGWEAPSALTGSVIAVLRAGSGEARMVELDAADGAMRRETALAEAPGPPLLLAGEQVVAAGKTATSIISRAGEILGQIESRGAAFPVAGYGLLLLPAARGLRCVDTGTLETVWEAELPAAPDSLACERGLIVAASGGRLFCLGAP